MLVALYLFTVKYVQTFNCLNLKFDPQSLKSSNVATFRGTFATSVVPNIQTPKYPELSRSLKSLHWNKINEHILM